MKKSSAIIRDAHDNDIVAMHEVYSPIVESSPISLELEPPSIIELSDRVKKYQSKWAWIIYEQEGKLLGYAYGAPHRERAAYQWTVETSVYVSSEARGQGVGTALYSTLLTRLTELGYCNALAIIVLPNEASVAAHARAGFKEVGVFPAVGRKFGRWYDVGWYYKKLQTQPLEQERLQKIKSAG
jgi:phosphinothricin acetyltransferase